MVLLVIKPDLGGGEVCGGWLAAWLPRLRSGFEVKCDI